MPDPSRRRRFRFSMGTMLVVVTALCCWLGWETHIVRQRRAVMNEMKGSYAFSLSTVSIGWAPPPPPGSSPPPAARISLIRSWLGDEAIQEIWFTQGMQGYSDAELRRLERVFPEAKLYESFPEPCHPGCFPHGTLVDTPAGRRPIEEIKVGDELVAILKSGEPTAARVQSIFVTNNRLWRVQTDAGDLLTTETQPLCVAVDEILPAGALQPAGSVMHRREDGTIHAVNVRAASRTERIEKVFNLVLDDSEIFVAGGFLARSKPPAEPTDCRPDTSNYPLTTNHQPLTTTH